MIGLVLAVALAGPWEQTKALRIREVEQLRPPTVEERLGLGRVVGELVRAAPSGELPEPVLAQARALGLQLTREEDVLLIGGPHGWGLVALRLGPASSLVFQAPHPWYDLGTGELTGKLFAESSARAAVFATTHRRLAARTDVAHEATGGFQVLTLALADALEGPSFVQIHGFGDGHTGAEVVLGGWGAGSLAEPLAASGLLVTDGKAVPTLAGQTNLQVRALAGQAPVAHLELSRDLRKRLREDVAERARVLDVLERWAR